MTPGELGYPPLVLEATAISLALKKLEYYLRHGPNVILLTDHRPLSQLFAGPVDQCPSRLLPFMEAWRCFPNMEIHFIQSKQNVLADTLSRKYSLQNSNVVPNRDFCFSLKEQAVLADAAILNASLQDLLTHDPLLTDILWSASKCIWYTQVCRELAAGRFQASLSDLQSTHPARSMTDL